VFVADYGNHQVVLLDSQLKWIQVVLSAAKDGLTSPIALWYDGEVKHLVAARSFTRKEKKDPYKTTPIHSVTMEPAIYVASIPVLSKES